MTAAAVSKNDFSRGKMWANILRQAIPLTIAQAVQVLYNIVDRIYLGHLPGSSGLALTGVGLIFPIVALITAFCNLFATGGTPLCSIARGAGKQERAERLMNTSVPDCKVTSSTGITTCYEIVTDNYTQMDISEKYDFTMEMNIDYFEYERI